MPRKTPLPESEKLIGSRVKQFREQKLISQTNFALKLYISRAQLINYEEGLSPLPWVVAFNLNQYFDVNPRWLATGKLPASLRTKLPHGPTSEYGTRALFSEVYPTVWKKHVEAETLKLVTFGSDSKKKGNDIDAEIVELAMHGWLQRLPENQFRTFLLELSAEAERIILEINPSDSGPIPLQPH